MPQLARHSSGTLTSSRDGEFKTDAPGILSQDQGFEYESSDDTQSDDEPFRKLKELFEQNAGLITPGCRDTIDSILSKYGAVRNAVQQDSRIGIVLSAEFSTTAITQSFPAGLADFIDEHSVEEATDFLKDEGVCNAEGSQFDVTYDLMVAYAEHLLQATAASTSVVGSSTSLDGKRDKYDTDDIKTAWDNQEDTLLDVYAELNTDLFQAQIGMENPIDEAKVAKPAVTAVLVPKKEDELLGTPGQTMSPIVQVAMFELQSVASSDRLVGQEPVPLSCQDYDARYGPIVKFDAEQSSLVALVTRTEHIDAAPPLKSFPDSGNDSVPDDLHEFVERPLRVGLLVPDDPASNTVVQVGQLNASCEKDHRVTERPVLGYDARCLLGSTSKHLHGDIEEWLEQIEAQENITVADAQYGNSTAAPPFFAWLQQDRVAEHVLDASIVVTLTIVAIIGNSLL